MRPETQSQRANSQWQICFSTYSSFPLSRLISFRFTFLIHHQKKNILTFPSLSLTLPWLSYLAFSHSHTHRFLHLLSSFSLLPLQLLSSSIFFPSFFSPSSTLTRSSLLVKSNVFFFLAFWWVKVGRDFGNVYDAMA